MAWLLLALLLHLLQGLQRPERVRVVSTEARCEGFVRMLHVASGVRVVFQRLIRERHIAMCHWARLSDHIACENRKFQRISNAAI